MSRQSSSSRVTKASLRNALLALPFVSLAAVGLQACDGKTNVPSMNRVLVSDESQKQETLTAKEATALKSSPGQARDLASDAVCSIPQGTVLIAESIRAEENDHWRVFKLSEVRLPTGEVGRVAPAATAQTTISSEASTPAPAPVKTPAELLGCALLSQESFLVYAPHFARLLSTPVSGAPTSAAATNRGENDSAFQWPTRGRRIRSDSGGDGHFGAPRASGKGHQGIDIVASVGEPIFASRSGTIIDPSYEASYGNVVDVQHASGYLSRYAHLTSFSYSHGTYVEQGAKIATSGRTGNAAGGAITPHLHFEIRQNNGLLNPLNLLP